MKITPKNKPLSPEERAANTGLLTIDKVMNKIVQEGYPSLEEYEKQMTKETIAKLYKKDSQNITEEEIFEQCKLIKIQYFNEMCEEKILQGFKCSNGFFYRTNRDDQTNMIGQKDDLNNSSETVIYWKTEDAGYRPHTRDEWLMMYQEAFNHKREKLFIYDSLKKEIQLAKSHEELLEITW